MNTLFRSKLVRPRSNQSKLTVNTTEESDTIDLLSILIYKYGTGSNNSENKFGAAVKFGTLDLALGVIFQCYCKNTIWRSGFCGRTKLF